MVPEKFRHQLRQEAEHWWQEGLIDRSVYEKIADRYQFSDIENAARNRFTAILMGLGGILMGLGTIIFVAANWEAWSRVSRLMLLVSLFLGVNATGFYLWRKPIQPRSFQNLGQSLLLLGALILGANMALVSQLFYESGNLYELFLAWGLGVATLSFSLRLKALGILAAILLQIGYWIGFSRGFNAPQWSWGQLTIEHMPLVGIAILIPLAYWCRSRAIFGLGTIAVMTSFLANILRFEGWILELAIGLPPALFWGYTEGIWRFGRFRRSSTLLEFKFQSIARSLSTIFISLVLYAFSFNSWKSFQLGKLNIEQWQLLQYFTIDISILTALTFLGLFQFRSPGKSIKVGKSKAVNSLTILALIIISGSLVFWHLHIYSIATSSTIAFNVMLFLLAISLIRDGLAGGVRRTFWGGTFLLSVGIASRMLEYNTGLLLQSLVFVLCGVGVMVAGLAFEQNIKKSKHLANSNSFQEESP
ncbi:MAG: DUF2157 domain-containing protein [Geitlerinemataceae cyanobacterium]